MNAVVAAARCSSTEMSQGHRQRVDSAAMRADHLKPVAAAVAMVLGLASPVAMATIRPVTSCLDDNSAGTLRSVIGAVSTISGDTVDLAGLAGLCPGNTITLQAGGSHIYINQSSLTIRGPADSVLAIDGSALAEGNYYNYSNLFLHTQTGTLAIQDLALSGGHQKHKIIDSLGGCLASKGNVSLTNVTISSCTNRSYNVTAKGGAVYAAGNVTLTHSTISDSSNTGITCKGGAVYAKGLLTLTHSTVSGNSSSCYSAVKGGGVYAVGNLTAQYSEVSGNSAEATHNVAYGGGLFAKGTLTLQASVVSGNKADGAYGSVGGGAEVIGTFLGSYSTIDGNITYGSGFGAGLNLNGTTNSILGSTISNNVSQGGFAGIDVVTGGIVGSTFEMRNTTISGNIAFGGVGGLYVDSRAAKLYNSTIAFNEAAIQPGVHLVATNASMQVTLQSTLLSNNTLGGGEDDLSVFASNGHSVTFNGGDLAAPANNLVRASAVMNLPTDTLSGVCPHLGALRDNGGLTATHALQSQSAAIDAGNLVFLSFFDQRGSSLINGTIDYPRVSANAADIGAYEAQQNDMIFNADYEGCPSLL